MMFKRNSALNPAFRDLYHGGYHVHLPGRAAVVRPNKTAAGMSWTAARAALFRSHRLSKSTNPDGLSDDALRLVVRGTLATTRGITYGIERVACPCCRSKAAGPLRLNDRGRRRLQAARLRKTTKSRTAPPDGFASWARFFPE